jgi:hypothetical protein
MTHETTDHKIRKSTSPHHTTSHEAVSADAREGEIAASATMIEACDRLGQKLDEVAGIVQEQFLAWQQIQQSSGLNAGARERQTDPAHDNLAPASWVDASRGASQPGGSEIDRGQFVGASGPNQTGGGGAGAPGYGGTAAETVRRLVDTLTSSGNGWEEQAASLQQALAGIMEYLEGQTAAPKADVADIMSRLRNLEEEQQSLQSQFNNNRWGP